MHGNYRVGDAKITAIYPPCPPQRTPLHRRGTDIDHLQGGAGVGNMPKV